MGAVRLQVSELILRKLTGYMCSRVKTPQIPPFAARELDPWFSPLLLRLQGSTREQQAQLVA